MRHFKHRKKSFDELPLHARRTLAVKMGGVIRRDPNGRGVFTTYDILPGSEEWAEDMGGRGFWCDARFLGRDGTRKGRIWTATLEISAYRCAENFQGMAYDAVEAMFSDSDRRIDDAHNRFEFLPCDEKGYSTLNLLPELEFASLGGRSRTAAEADWMRENLPNLFDLAPLMDSAEILRGYRSGTGLNLALPVTNLTVDAAKDGIIAFLERGEVAYAYPVEADAEQEELARNLVRSYIHTLDRMEARRLGNEPPEYPEGSGNFLGASSNAIRT